jgi:hypothetical protein
MHRTHRAAGVAVLAVALAACAAPGTGGGSTEAPLSSVGAMSSSPPSANPTASARADRGELGNRVDIGALAEDPSSFSGEEITVLARVDQVLVDGSVFLTSPSASEEGQMAVIVRPDAQVDKEIVEGSVAWVTGSVIGLTEDELQQAGVDVAPDELGTIGGDFAIVADAIRDPLAGN